MRIQDGMNFFSLSQKKIIMIACWLFSK